MEDLHTVKNIIIQGFKGGYMSINNPKIIGGITMVNGKWHLPDGVEIGSTWDIILNPEFAKVVWPEDYQKHLMAMVIMSDGDRVEYLHSFFVEEKYVTPTSEAPEFVVSNDSLMSSIQNSLENLKEYSDSLFVETCNSTYERLKGVVSKTSVTELQEIDFIVMNSMDRVLRGGLSGYLNNYAKPSFTVCPECGVDDFTHVEGCSIDRKGGDYLISLNDGC